MSTSTQAPALRRSPDTGGDPGMQEPQARPPGGAQGVGRAPSPAPAPPTPASARPGLLDLVWSRGPPSPRGACHKARVWPRGVGNTAARPPQGGPSLPHGRELGPGGPWVVPLYPTTPTSARAPPPGTEGLLGLHGALLGLEPEVLHVLPELLIEPLLDPGAQPLAPSFYRTAASLSEGLRENWGGGLGGGCSRWGCWGHVQGRTGRGSVS